MAATYNTVPFDDASASKPKTSIKLILVAAAVASFALVGTVRSLSWTAARSPSKARSKCCPRMNPFRSSR